MLDSSSLFSSEFKQLNSQITLFRETSVLILYQPETIKAGPCGAAGFNMVLSTGQTEDRGQLDSDLLWSVLTSA